MDYWQTVQGMLQVYVPSIGLFFIGGTLGRDIAHWLGISLRAEWTRWMTTLYVFSLLIPLPLWLQGSLFYGNLWLVYALLSLGIGIARGLAFPDREQLQRDIRERLERAKRSIQQSLDERRDQNNNPTCELRAHAGTRTSDV